MTFEQWLAANGYAADKLTEKERAHLMAAWEKETKPAAPVPPAAPTMAAPTDFDEQIRAAEANSQRIAYIRERTLAAFQAHTGDLAKQAELKKLCESAVEDKKVDKQAFDLALLRLDRAIGPMILTPRAVQTNDDLLEAAVCMSHRLSGLEKRFSAETLDAAQRTFKHGLSLRDLLAVAAERNSGYRGSTRDYEALCRHAFARNAASGAYYEGLRADVGPSTISVPGILSNVANKFLSAGFLYTEQTWRMVAKIKSANDFKQMSTYRLTGNNKFLKIAPNGEIKHGTLSELTYTNKVEQYGRLLGIGRPDIINDDLGAFTGAADELGRGAGDSLNEVFWTEWLDDATFFPTDKSNANYDDGATDSVLSLAGLENADNIFREQTKPDGTPMGIDPAILLVPSGLRITAWTLVNSTEIVGQGASAGALPNKNPHAGAYKPASSVYLRSAAIAGSSATGWYLLADPNNCAAIEVAFLFGREAPTVEQGEFDFDRLGIAMRAYMDFGCAKQEYRAAVKMKGAA